MDVLTGTVETAPIFVSAGQQQAQLETMANQALSSGIDKYQREDYEGAVKDFQRSMGIAPRSDYSVEAASFMARSYLKLNRPDDAVKAYDRAVEMNPQREDTRTSLGNLLFSLERYSEAEEHYRQAFEINPHPNNAFSLGQVHMRSERWADAEESFRKVIDLAPESGNGEYGLGLTYSHMGRLEEAVEQFQKAISLRGEDFLDGQIELGFAYADMGEMQKAQEIYELIEAQDEDMADTLNRYMYKVEKPRFEFATADSTFNYHAPSRSSLEVLDSYLTTANAEKKFSMEFQFGKRMDMASVQNRFNWQISRSSGSEPGGMYNFGLKIPETEVKPMLYPDHVVYDPTDLRAKITFTIRQNDAADGTIDPSHLTFTFSGKDANGISMDPEGDSFNGFSGVF